MNNFLENYKCIGTKLDIIKYPAKVLSTKAKPVEQFDDDLHETIKNMLYTMYNAPGIGLAAPQIGISKRFFVSDTDYTREEIVGSDGEKVYELSNFNPQVFINPIITKRDGEYIYEEGCLSLPGYYEEVTRAENITLEYQDMFGEKHTLESHELNAICLQHEFDHLDGIVFIDRLSLLKRKFLKKKILKEKKNQ